MEIYLIRHGQTNGAHVDPYTQPLTAEGLAQAECLAERCADWGIEFICVSTMRCAEQTADAISEVLPEAVRWDLQELEAITTDDLMGDPVASPLVSAWSKQQLALGYEQMHIRVMAALVRIQLYADTRGIERIGIVADVDTLKLLLLNWFGSDWRAMSDLDIPIDHAATCKVTLNDGDVRIDWVNRPSC